jgi:hypothetical protein
MRHPVIEKREKEWFVYPIRAEKIKPPILNGIGGFV